jgi:uncharacterized protein YifE (UPF0438 family)
LVRQEEEEKVPGKYLKRKKGRKKRVSSLRGTKGEEQGRNEKAGSSLAV